MDRWQTQGAWIEKSPEPNAVNSWIDRKTVPFEARRICFVRLEIHSTKSQKFKLP